MKKNFRRNIDKNKKYTYDEMRIESLKLYAEKLDNTLFQISCVISSIWMHMMQDIAWELTPEQIVSMDEEKIIYRHSDKDIAIAHEELTKLIEDWSNGEFTTDELHDVYKVIYQACRKYLKKTQRSLAE